MSKILIHKPSHSLIIPHNQEVVDAIPRSKSFTFKGRELTQVYHGEAETLKLRSMGIDAPAPMETYYDWPILEGKYTVLDHQKEGAAFMSLHRKCFNLSEPRTGKTYSILMTFDYLRKIGKVKKLIIYTTLSTIQEVWVKSIFSSFHEYSYAVIHGKDRLEALKEDVDIYITNHDGVKLIKDHIHTIDDLNMVVWDEADVLCNAQTALWKDFNSTLEDNCRLILATGTPTGDGDPTAAWALAKLVSPERVPKYFGSFKRMTMIQISQFKWRPNKDAKRIVYEALQPAICFRKKDVLQGIPDTTTEFVECELSDEQKRMFKELKNDMETEYAKGTISAVNAADKMTKVLQVLLGAFKAEDGEYHSIDCQPRIDKLLWCIGNAKKKTIVFVPWRGAIEHYFKEVKKHYSCAMVNGTVSKNARDRIFYDFAHAKAPQVLFAQQRTTAHGLEFSCADTIVWAGPPHSGRQFMQANERNNSIKQDTEMTTWYLHAAPVEKAIYYRLLDKKSLQDDVLDLYRQVIKETTL